MKLPAYGRDLIALQRTGRNISWLVISLGWDYGKAVPRLVVPHNLPVSELDLSMLGGIECTVAHSGKSSRALDVAELALRNGASRCGVFDMERGKPELTTDEVMAIRGLQ
jgi:hypothetical protein